MAAKKPSAPKKLKEGEGPVEVVHKVSKKKFTVSRAYFEANEGKLELA